MFVQTEITPNPNALKFLPGKKVSEIGPVEFLKSNKADYLFVSAPENVAWILNIRGGDSPNSPVPNSRLIIGKDKKISEIYHIDFGNIRRDKDDRDKFYYTSDWNNKPTKNDDFEELYSFPWDESEVVEELLSLESMEKDMITKALKKYKSRRKDAAKELGISERTLYRKIKQYKIEK
mgnify:CR=1 FL=1